jgi:hypothetical protein
VAVTTRQMNPDFTLVEDGPGARMSEMTYCIATPSHGIGESPHMLVFLQLLYAAPSHP